MVPQYLCCTIETKVETKDVIVTSLADCLRRYGAIKKTIILVQTVLEVEIGPKATTSGRRRSFLVVKFDLGGGDIRVDTINIRSVRLHTPEPLRPDTDGDGGERADASTTTTTGDTTITYSVSILVFKVPALDP